MANESANRGLPIPYITAVWVGMSRDDIVAGLRAGSILPPPGAVRGWLPDGSAAESASGGSEAAPAIVDRARVEAWFRALDPELAPSAFDSLWAQADGEETARAMTFMGYLADLLPGGAGARPPAAVANDVDAFVADPSHRAQLVDLTAKTGDELAALAKTDIGYRYALANLQPFALTGNRSLLAAANGDGQLDRFDPDTGEALLSDAWLADRGKFLAWKAAQESGTAMAVAGSEDWTFIDRGIAGADGAPLTVKIESGVAGAGVNQVVFGTGDDEVLRGVSGSDRIYAGGGDDVLRGGAGGDHLEGGAGDDLVMGGMGDDEVLGNQGDDELDGGHGVDRLQGGSGDDLLIGGRGADRLEGGSGNDTYAIDSGDGNDTIVDADGVGRIEIDGVDIGGAMSAGDGKWMSGDGRLEFTFTGDAGEPGKLTIRAFGAGADHEAAPDNVIEVRNWQNGDLGITLTGSPGGSQQAGGSTFPVTGPELEVVPPVEALAFAGEDSGDVTGDSAGTAALGGDNAPGGTSSSAAQGAVEPFDFDHALADLLGHHAPEFAAPDAGAVQHAIAEFSGVLEPPDVSFGVAARAGVLGAVTSVDVAEALAGDIGGADFALEMGEAAAPPALLGSDEIAGVRAPMARGIGNSG